MFALTMALLALPTFSALTYATILIDSKDAPIED